MGPVRERLFAINPETDLKTSVSYLKDASYALYMFRAKEGIQKGGSVDLIPFFRKILESKPDDQTESRLEEILSIIREGSLESGTVDQKANRFKAALCLLKAARVRHEKIS
jgi:hypothetical protein